MADSEENPETPPVDEAPSERRGLRHWLRIIPGTKRDYILISLAAIDTFGLMFTTTLEALVRIEHIAFYFIYFDFFVLTVWGIEFLLRLYREEKRIDFLLSHWYEVVGLIPLVQLRMFLLLRAAKLAIAYYKIGRSDQDVSRLVTREITFRFRDVIVDTIEDAIFQRSLQRVQEVMLSIDYNAMAKRVMSENQNHLRDVVAATVQSKSMFGELSKIPLLGGFVKNVGDDVSQVVVEVMEEEVVGEIFKGFAANILADMNTRLRELDVERLITSDRESLMKKYHKVLETKQNAE